ncbi:MAG: S41 family peptidase [Bacteroidales bacterium]|nr:S41 family peptidase [Bacteroidales bacterium]
MRIRERDAVLYLALTLAAGILLGTYMPLRKAGVTPSVAPSLSHWDKADYVRELIQTYYYEDLDGDSLTDEMITALLQALDPHSSYIPAKEAQRYNAVLMGGFEGIGITFNILDDTITVISVTPSGPSQKAGVLAGDKIIRVDGENVAGVHIQNADVIGKLRGKRGTKVRIEALRPAHGQLLAFDLVRDKIALKSVEVAYMLEPSIGYIQINSFSATTGDEFSRALHELLAQGMRQLVLDLRGNSGGSLQSAIAVCDEFLGRREVIVGTRGKAVGSMVYRATSYGSFEREDQSLVVLIDEWSASASEIVAGAVQDQDRGVVIGRRSFGKGLVQRSFNLPDSSELLLTVARYYTPTGRCIQKPFERYEEDIASRYLHGEMNSADSIPIADSLKFRTPKGRIVYGGGGIIPDIFVPIDTSEDYVYFNQLSHAGVIFRYALAYTDAHRAEWADCPDVRAFDRRFAVSDAMVAEIMRQGEAQSVSTQKATPGSRKEIKKWCKAYIARNLFGEEGFAYLSNQDDKMVRKAVQVLRRK